MIKFDTIMGVLLSVAFAFGAYTYTQDRAALQLAHKADYHLLEVSKEALKEDVAELKRHTTKFDLGIIAMDRRLLTVEMFVESNTAAVTEIRQLRADLQKLQWKKGS